MDTLPNRITFEIHGLGCGGGGAPGVERALERLPGVRRAYVNPLTEMAYVELDPVRVRPDQLVTTIRELGLESGPLEAR